MAGDKAAVLGTRQCKWEKRELLNAIFYVVKTGCQWRQLPHVFPPYQTVYSFYRRTLKNGLWDKILQYLVERTRERAGRTAQPSYGLIDSQSVKTVADSEERGIGGGKNERPQAAYCSRCHGKFACHNSARSKYT